ncbi:MAG: flagellar motor switch protein FliN [Planctomycetota bacterium]
MTRLEIDSNPDDVEAMSFRPLRESRSSNRRADIERYLDVELEVAVEVGTTHATLEDVLALVPGAVIRLDKRVGDPVDLRVNGKLIAHGEVVKVDDCFGIRITAIASEQDRGSAIGR